MKTKFFLSILIFILSIRYTYSQSTTLTPQGVMFPQMSTVQINALVNPSVGTLVYNTTTNTYWYRQNGSWAELPKAGSTSNYWSLAGAAGNEIKNTNSGGFWSANSVGLEQPSNDISNPPTAPVSGAGTRLMWIPSRSAFRSGTVTGDHASDWDATNIGLYSVALGFNTNASGIVSSALGANTIASGKISTAMGVNTTAFGDRSTAMGSNTFAGGYSSTTMGDGSIASGYSSVAMGEQTNAGGIAATTMGYHTSTAGNYSVGMGSYTLTFGSNSLAAGDHTKAVGANSITTGSYTTTFGDNCVTMGEGTIASSKNTLAIGAFNNDYYPYNSTDVNRFLLTVGNGSNDNNRRNCFEVRQTGTVQINHYTPVQDNPDRFGLRIKRDIATDSQFWTFSHPSNENLDIHYGASGAFKAYVRQSDGAWMQSSDIRLKEQIKPVESVLDKVVQLKVSRYFYKTDTLHTSLQMGLIAQEVKPLFPEFITQNGQYYGVNYGGMSVVALKAIQELKAENDKLKSEIQTQALQIKEILKTLKGEDDTVIETNKNHLKN